MRYFTVILSAMALLSSCSNNSSNNEVTSPYPEVSIRGGEGIEGASQSVSSLPKMEFAGLTYFNSSQSKKVKNEKKPEGVLNILSVLMDGDKIILNAKTDTMVYKISFTDSYETIGEESYGWRFNVSRTDTSFADLTEVCLYEEDKDGLPFFAFVNRNGQWSSWDIIKWDSLPKRKIMAKHPTDEEVASYQEKKLGEDFVGL
ncbi:MAG: hypothetical protein MJZ33_10930 [Paludibacteraceae bacterium]|nr:hypothetical protein [Paludibacteraceae bacterium]